MPGLSSTARDVETIRVGALRLQRRDSNQQSFMDSGVLGSFSGHHDVIISFSAICRCVSIAALLNVCVCVYIMATCTCIIHS